MTALTWDKPSTPRFEAGVDRGVVYPSTGGGFAWNGLLTVDEGFEGGETEEVRFEGIRRSNSISNRNWSASVKAFAIPRALEQCVGMVEIAPGFILTRQPHRQFGLSYRVQTSETSSEIHLIYNATATPDARGHKTRSNETEPTNLSYRINAVPDLTEDIYATAHFVLNPTGIPIESYVVIEELLYGTDRSSPRLPSIIEILDIILIGDFRSIFPQPISGKADLLDNQTENLDLAMSSTPGIFTKMPNSRLYQDLNDPVGLNRLEQ